MGCSQHDRRPQSEAGLHMRRRRRGRGVHLVAGLTGCRAMHAQHLSHHQPCMPMTGQHFNFIAWHIAEIVACC